MKLPPITILYDTREKADVQNFITGEGVTIQKATLETGDFSAEGITHLLAIEYKQLSDLAQCCGRDRERFTDQCRRLRNYPVRALIVGRPEEEVWAEAYTSRIKGSSVAGTLMGMSVRYGIPVWFCNGRREAARRIVWICRKVAQLQKEGFYDEHHEGQPAASP